LALSELLDSPLILPSATNPTRGLIDAAAKTLGRSVNTRQDVDSVTLLKDLSAAGFGVAILPYAAVAREVGDGRLTARPIIKPEIPCDLNLIFRRDRPPNRLAEHLIVEITELLSASLSH
jgi:LysR family nitrogen assimilation transcriptional regulator